MKAITQLSLAICVVLGSVNFSTAYAAPETFSDQAQFSAVLTDSTRVLNFDRLPTGMTIPNDSTAEGITFSYSFNGLPMKVTHLYATTSAPNFLGTADGGMLHDGDDFKLSFVPSSAIGLFFIRVVKWT